MKITISKRAKNKKRDPKRIRREGNIPAVLYSAKTAAEEITVDGREFSAAIRQIEKGGLPTVIFTLTDEQGLERKAIVKDIQYNITSYDVIHLDFELLHDDSPVKINIPIRFKGEAICAGVKLGGVIRQVIRCCKISCLPLDIPKEFILDVSALGLKQSLRLSDIKMSDKVRPLVDTREVAVVIAKR